MQDPMGSVWLMSPAEHTKRLLARGEKDRVTFRWSANGRFLLVLRASAGSVAVYEAPAGKLIRFMGDGAPLSGADVSPNGRYVSLIRGHNLWLASLAGKSLNPLTSTGNEHLLAGEPDPVYAREFDVERHYWWAPDSSSVAFIETEFRTPDHYPLPGSQLPLFRLRTVEVNSAWVRTIAESSDEWPYILRVTWHPDSRRAAFYRMNRFQNKAELCLFDNGSQRTIVIEKDDYWVNAPETPLFVSNGKRVVVSSERSGHRHVYLYALDGTMINDLTPPDLEVNCLYSAVREKNAVYVSASAGNRQEQHLFRLNLEGGASQLTSEAGWHQVALSAAGTAYLDSYSSSTKPPSAWWHDNAFEPRELLPPSSTQKPVANEFLLIQTHDKVNLPARLYKPDDFNADKKYAVILYTFSGPKGRVVQDAWGGWQMAWNRYLAGKGYLVLAVDLRGSGGYGHLFEEYLHYRLGGQEMADLREVVGFLRRQSYVDPERLGIWGCDYGGNTVAQAMLEFPHGFKAGFADSPITNWSTYDAYFTERYLGLPAHRKTEYDGSSPLENGRRITGDWLVTASDDNPIIRRDQLLALETAMNGVKNPQVSNRLHVIRLSGVAYREYAGQLAELLASASEFFEQRL
jgi:dipeptidyl-peptidase-4